MGEITELEMSVDVVQMLAETENAITVLGQNGIDVPAEAIQMRSMMRRCVAAEMAKAELLQACRNLLRCSLPVDVSGQVWIAEARSAIAKATGAKP